MTKMSFICSLAAKLFHFVASFGRNLSVSPHNFLFLYHDIYINQSIFWTRLSLGGRGGSSSSWSLQASRSSATKDRCSAGMPRRDQLRSLT